MARWSIECTYHVPEGGGIGPDEVRETMENGPRRTVYWDGRGEGTTRLYCCCALFQQIHFERNQIVFRSSAVRRLQTFFFSLQIACTPWLIRLSGQRPLSRVLQLTGRDNGISRASRFRRSMTMRFSSRLLRLAFAIPTWVVALRQTAPRASLCRLTRECWDMRVSH